MKEWLRFAWCRVVHREGVWCVRCWMRSEAAAKARHPAGRWWFR